MASTSAASPPPASPKAPSPPSAPASASAGPSKSPTSEAPRPVLESTWHALSQAPPPALREILSAYNAKGEGDRDMLVALLNAKSAEDQRLSAIATLHQTILQMQHALAIAAVTAQSPPGRVPPPSSAAQAQLPAQQPLQQSQLQPSQSRRKRSHADCAPDAYRLQPYDEREPTLPPSPESSASSPPRSEFPHLSNPGTMSIRTLLHPSKRRRENGYDERAYDDRYDERVYDERDRERERDRDRDREREREYRSRDTPRRPHVVVHPPSVERDSHRYAMRTSSAREEAAEAAGRSP
ncbi:hypothetical protein FRC09_000232 [Ceratobasidium sp. 395]|nr:hypothetical protein FRC09_000232 [Ceratobasidium sp. 395]